MSVLNPMYPITPEVIAAICNPVAQLLRVNINRKSGIQVQFKVLSWIISVLIS